jgi:hypothetical protein
LTAAARSRLAHIAGRPDKIRDILLDGATSIWKARCQEVHDDIDLEEDPKVIAKREKEKVEAIWKDIDDARQCGKPRDEIIATDRRGIDKVTAPKLNGHIRKLEAYLHTITKQPAHEFIRTRDDNITVEYEETDARHAQDPAQQEKFFRGIDILISHK